MAEETNNTQEEATDTLAEEVLAASKRLLTTGIQARRVRFRQIELNEALLSQKSHPTMTGRFNVPIDAMTAQGFKQTLISKIDNPVNIIFDNKNQPQHLFAARKKTAAWEVDSGADKGDWAGRDLESKANVVKSGRAILKYFADSSEGEYESNLEVVDHWDFVTEPNGGNKLENHLFMFQKNIFKTEKELLDGVEAGIYDKIQVRLLIKNKLDSQSKRIDRNEDEKTSNVERYGTQLTTNNFVGEDVYRLVEGGVTYKGKRRYILFSQDASIWIRFENLEDVFKSNLWPWVSWAYDVEATVFWSVGPLDQIRPALEASRVLFNQTLDNIEKRNWEMRAFDHNIFPNPEQFRYKPDGLIRAKVPAGKSIRDGIFTIETPNTAGITVNMLEFIKNSVGVESGISAATEGVSEEQRVGIHFSNLQQVADRLGLTNKLYSQMWTELGVRYDWGLLEHMPQDFMVEYVGSEGVEWKALTKQDIQAPVRARVVGGNTEEALLEIRGRKQNSALTNVLNAGLGDIMNKKILATEMLEKGEWEQSKIRALLDPVNQGTEEVIARAEGAISEILRGKKAKPWRGANVFFIQYIIDYAIDEVFNEKKFIALNQYAEAHLEIAARNAERKVQQIEQRAAEAALTQETGTGEPTSNLKGGEAPDKEDLRGTSVGENIDIALA